MVGQCFQASFVQCSKVIPVYKWWCFKTDWNWVNVKNSAPKLKELLSYTLLQLVWRLPSFLFINRRYYQISVSSRVYTGWQCNSDMQIGRATADGWGTSSVSRYWCFTDICLWSRLDSYRSFTCHCLMSVGIAHKATPNLWELGVNINICFVFKSE
jgi:hypothetical protein